VKIKIITTGGTIDKIYFDQKSEYQIGDPQACGLLKRANVVIDYDVKSLLRKDSLELTDADRDIIYRAVDDEECGQIIVTHGTDTMIQTAKMLAAAADKTIVMTGSMYPARFADSDAIFNVACAVTAVQLLSAGVYIAMNGKIFNPFNARKNVEQNRFELL
jgi:L-asparaginase